MRDDTDDTQFDAESWEEPQDEDTVIPPGPVSARSQIAAGGQPDGNDDIRSPGAEIVAELPIDTHGWTSARAPMSISQPEPFGTWTEAISGADLPVPHDDELAELFSEDDSQIGFDSDEQVVL